MKIAVFGDIHANIEALDAVLTAVNEEAPCALYHVGDIVGYCVDFDKVIETVKDNNIEGVMGNHELMVLGRLSTEKCVAKDSIDWTAARINNQQREFIAALPPSIRKGDVIIFHAQPDSYVKYISNETCAESVFKLLDERHPGWRIAIHGHTHKQRVFERSNGKVRLVLEGAGELHLDLAKQYILSPGSVGVSRDSDPRSAYTIYDDGLVAQYRINYDLKACESKIREAGLATQLFRKSNKGVGRSQRMLDYLRSIRNKIVQKANT